MRFVVVAALALGLTAPASASALAPGLRLSMAGPLAGMERSQPALAERLALDPDLAGSGAGAGRPEPVLALVLGIIPGFGLGHFYAGATGQAYTWLIIDLALLGGSIVIWSVAGSPLDALIWIAWVVERGFEGYFAFTAAGGARHAAAPAPATGALASLDPRSSPALGASF
jgi:hypothetical protein